MSLFYYVSLPILYAVSFAVPFYKTFKTLQKVCSSSGTCDESAKEPVGHWLKFWILAALSSQLFSFYERSIADVNSTSSIVYLVAKIVWFYWLSTPQGSLLVYQYTLVPTLVHHEAQIDQWIGQATHLVTQKSQTFLHQVKNRAGSPTRTPPPNGSNKKRDH